MKANCTEYRIAGTSSTLLRSLPDCNRHPAPTALSLKHLSGNRLSYPGTSLSTRDASIRCQAVADKKKSFTSFDDMLSDTDVPILVDFYATWCGPCQLMSGIISDVAASFPEDIQIVKIDTDKYPHLATRFRVQALPTLMLFRNGKVLDRIEGVLDQRMLGNRLRYYLKGLDAKFGKSQR